MIFVITWTVRLIILLPLLLLKQFSDTAERWYDNIECWLEQLQ